MGSVRTMNYETTLDAVVCGDLKLVIHKGKQFLIRTDTTDAFVANEVLTRNIYLKHQLSSLDDRWLDVGGHIGLFSIAASMLSQCVVCFEPEPQNLSLIRANLNLNRISNVMTYGHALVADDTETLPLYLNGGVNTGNHSLYSVQGRKYIDVPCSNINKVVQSLKINKIKMDCEGAELDLIPAIDFSNIDFFICEMHFSFSKRDHHQKYNECIAHLKQHFDHVSHPVEPLDKWERIIIAKNFTKEPMV